MADIDELQALEPGDLLADRAYRQLSRAILRNQLVAGTPLSVPELARRLNISRSPVREAVQRLIYDGLAANVPHRGAIVSEIKPDDFRGLLEVRQVLEGLAARLATERATDDDLRSLNDVLEDHAGARVRRRARQRGARHPVPHHHPGGGGQRRSQHDPPPHPGPRSPVPLHPVAGQAQHPGRAGGAPGGLRRHGRPRCRRGRAGGAAAHLEPHLPRRRGDSRHSPRPPLRRGAADRDDGRDRATGRTAWHGPARRRRGLGVPTRRHAQGHRQLRLLVGPAPAGRPLGRHAAQPAPAGPHREARRHCGARRRRRRRRAHPRGRPG